MAAPGGLLFAKIIKPEVDTPNESLKTTLMVVTTSQLTLSTQQQAVHQLVYN